MSVKYIITGGGTGGHLAIASAFLERLENAAYIGSSSGQDKAWMSGENKTFAAYFLPSRGFVGTSKVRKILAIFMLALSCFLALFLLLRLRPKAIISVGGYASLPACIAGKILGIKIFLHEQNARMGLANRIVSRFASKVFCAYTAASLPQKESLKEPKELLKLAQNGDLQAFFTPQPKEPNNETFSASFAPYPLRKRLQNPRGAINSDAANCSEQNICCVLILGGSSGASALNELAINLAPKLLARGISLLHQCGEKNLASTQAAYAAARINTFNLQGFGVFDEKTLATKPPQNREDFGGVSSSTSSHDFGVTNGAKVYLVGFCEQIEKLYMAADFAISRAGASAVAELLAARVPTLFIPYPYAASNHQFYNALSASSQGFALLCEQANISADLANALINPSTAARLLQRLKTLPEANGAQIILKSIDDFLA